MRRSFNRDNGNPQFDWQVWFSLIIHKICLSINTICCFLQEVRLIERRTPFQMWRIGLCNAKAGEDIRILEMRFSKNVVLFVAAGIPIVANLSNGYLIGLTSDAANLCQNAVNSDVPDDLIRSVDERLLEHLKRGRFSVDDGSSAAAQKTKTAYVHVTSECNMKCKGCYSEASRIESKSDLTFDQIKVALDNLRRAGVEKLVISGGEPFLRSDLPAILSYGKEHCQFDSIEVLTNGTLLSRASIDSVKPYISRISISIDKASSQSKGYIRPEQSYDQVISSVKLAKERGAAVHILPTLHKFNIEDFQQYEELSVALGVSLSFSLLSCAGEIEARHLQPNDSALVRLAELLLESRFTVGNDGIANKGRVCLTACKLCGAGSDGVSVGEDGSVYPCHLLHYENLSMGNILASDCGDLFARNPLETLSVDEIPGCNRCEVRYLCGGGCRARAYSMRKNILDKDPYCALMKTYYLKFLSMMNSVK